MDDERDFDRENQGSDEQRRRGAPADPPILDGQVGATQTPPAGKSDATDGGRAAESDATDEPDTERVEGALKPDA